MSLSVSQLAGTVTGIHYACQGPGHDEVTFSLHLNSDPMERVLLVTSRGVADELLRGLAKKGDRTTIPTKDTP